MQIRQNLPALNALRHRKRNQTKLSKNLEKLSSGLHINRAADDAAGLAISEKLRALIRGLDATGNNTQDVVSLLQTAEGGLQETHDMLGRLFELAEQSANGTYNDAVDREALAREFEDLCAEIDRVAQGTNFNGIPLLKAKGAGAAANVGGRTGTDPAPAAASFPGRRAAAAGSAGPAVPTPAAASEENAIPALEVTALLAAPRAGSVTCGDFTVEGGALDIDFSYENNTLTILTDTAITIMGTTSADRILVAKDVSANLTLHNVNINRSATSYAAAFAIADDSSGDVSVTVTGTNSLKSGNWCAGLQKSGGTATGTLTIDGTGSLEAVGGKYSAGIGGGNGKLGSNITINGGTVTATGGERGAGIGGGVGKTGSNIIINDGTITATGGNGGGGAGIGGGAYGEGRRGGDGIGIVINGGNVTATCHDAGGGAGIGGGRRGTGEVTINGGKIVASGSGGAGIGAGGSVDAPGWEKGAGDAIVTITGGEITAFSGQSAGIGGGVTSSRDTNRVEISITGGMLNVAGNWARPAIGGGVNSHGSVDISGNTVIIAKVTGVPHPVIGDGGGNHNIEINKNGGLIIENGTGKTYGNVDLSHDISLDSSAVVTVGSGHTLTVGSGTTLTNNGTIINDGIIQNDGAIMNNGAIVNNGTIRGNPISGNANFAYPVTASLNGITLVPNQIYTISVNGSDKSVRTDGDGKLPLYLEDGDNDLEYLDFEGDIYKGSVTVSGAADAVTLNRVTHHVVIKLPDGISISPEDPSYYMINGTVNGMNTVFEPQNGIILVKGLESGVNEVSVVIPNNSGSDETFIGTANITGDMILPVYNSAHPCPEVTLTGAGVTFAVNTNYTVNVDGIDQTIRTDGGGRLVFPLADGAHTVKLSHDGDRYEGNITINGSSAATLNRVTYHAAIDGVTLSANTNYTVKIGSTNKTLQTDDAGKLVLKGLENSSTVSVSLVHDGKTYAGSATISGSDVDLALSEVSTPPPAPGYDGTVALPPGTSGFPPNTDYEVEIDGNQQTITTDNGGNLIIPALPDGDHTIKIEHDGFIYEGNVTVSGGNVTITVEKGDPVSLPSGSGNVIRFQIGTSTGETLDFVVRDMDCAGIGIGGMSVATQQQAADALDGIKGAINRVSSHRGYIGALQNRLEHSLNNLHNAVENITMAESRIRDTDMAAEMMDHTRQTILAQAVQAMLAQANMQPQQVLQLLQP